MIKQRHSNKMAFFIMQKKLFVLGCLVVALSGCTTTQYQQSVNATNQTINTTNQLLNTADQLVYTANRLKNIVN